MRRGLFGVAAVLALAIAGYSVFWFIAADRVEGGLQLAAQALRGRNLDLSWSGVRVVGFPFAFTVEMQNVRLRDLAPAFAGEATAPVLAASTVPWNYHVWRLAAPQGIRGATDTSDSPAARLTAKNLDGAALVARDGAATLWLDAAEVAVDAAMPVKAVRAFLWLGIPAHPPAEHSEPTVGIAMDAWDITVPFAPPPLKNPVSELAVGVTVLGKIAQGPARQAAEAWRDSGGTFELDKFTLRWDALTIRGSGTAALDRDLQPEASFTAGVEGYPELMWALVAAGRIRRSDAGIADIALGFLAHPGPDGRPEIKTPFTIQDGQMFLGPARLGPAPHIAW